MLKRTPNGEKTVSSEEAKTRSRAAWTFLEAGRENCFYLRKNFAKRQRDGANRVQERAQKAQP